MTLFPTRARNSQAFIQRRHVPNTLLLQWHITDRCNLRCAHCYQGCDSGEELGLDELRSIAEQFKDALDFWEAESGKTVRGHITVTGGEPFVRGDFFDLLEILADNKHHFGFAILTNGSLIDAAAARRLRKLGTKFVQVSIEGLQEAHDVIRGRGQFDRAVKAIEHLVHERVRTFISFTAHRGNFQEFGHVADLGRRLRVARVWADRLIPNGRGAALSEGVLTPAETREFFEIMHKARTCTKQQWFNRTEIAMHRALEFLLAGGNPYRCTAGDTLVTVMPNGDVYPCRRMPVRVGNLFEDSLEKLYHESDFLRGLRDRKRRSKGCEGCCYADLCRGGLKCLSYAMNDDPFHADPGCWLANSKPLQSQDRP